MNPASAMYKIIYARNARNPLYYTLPSKLCNTWILNIRIWITFIPCSRGENLSLIIILKILSPYSFNLTSFLHNSKIEVSSILKKKSHYFINLSYFKFSTYIIPSKISSIFKKLYNHLSVFLIYSKLILTCFKIFSNLFIKSNKEISTILF